MDYPRLIYLDEETERRLESYIESELLSHYGERSAWVSDLVSLQKQYMADPPAGEKTFPFKGAANLIIPLIATVVEALHSKIMTSLFALDDIAVVKVPGMLEDINYGLSKYTNYELLEEGADMYRFCDNAFLECYKLGSMAGKVGYEKIEKTAVRQDGDDEHEFTIVTKQGPCADNLYLANFLMPFAATDPQTAPWCGEEHLPTAYRFKQLCDSGMFYPDTWSKLEQFQIEINSQEQSSFQYIQEMRSLQNQQPIWPKNIGFVELWMSFDVDDSKKDKEIVVYYHRLSRKIIGARYNWYDDLRRPYRIGKYFNFENRWAGIGVGHQVKVFQREVTTQHRQRLDNATIANIRMFKVNKLAGYGPGEPIFPGKLWFLDNMDDLEAFQAGEIYPSSFNDEIQTLQYAQQRSGVNELNLGMPQTGTPGTASSDMARLQEGSRKYDYTTKNMKRFAQQICKDVIYNAAMFGPSKVDIFKFLPDGPDVQNFLNTVDPALICDQLVMNIQLIGQNENKLQDRASWTQISGTLTQYYTQLFQFAMQIGDQKLMQRLAQLIPAGATEAMSQILQTYDIRNLDRIIPQELILGYKAMIQPQNMQMLLGQGNGTTTDTQGSGSGTSGAGQTQGVPPTNSSY